MKSQVSSTGGGDLGGAEWLAGGLFQRLPGSQHRLRGGGPGAEVEATDFLPGVGDGGREQVGAVLVLETEVEEAAILLVELQASVSQVWSVPQGSIEKRRRGRCRGSSCWAGGVELFFAGTPSPA